MCIITGPIHSVTSTKILVAPSWSRNRQLVVYSNTVATEARTMMILPVPNPASVQFEEGVMLYKNLFKNAAVSFYTPKAAPSMSRSAYEDSPLPVLNVGTYKASIANSVNDLLRLDTDVFNISSNLIEMLTRHYSPREFGFICCVLKPGGNTYEPIAYTHEIGHNGPLFVPTKHYHETTKPDSFYGGLMATLREDSVDDWDHEIYSVGTTVATAHNTVDGIFLPAPRNQINWGQFPPEYQYNPGVRLCRWGMKGRYKNVDLEFAIA